MLAILRENVPGVPNRALLNWGRLETSFPSVQRYLGGCFRKKSTIEADFCAKTILFAKASVRLLTYPSYTMKTGNNFSDCHTYSNNMKTAMKWYFSLQKN